MSLSKKIPLVMYLASAFAIYSNTARADHGSMGFGIGTASPIITQSGITLPVGMWAGGLITQFTRFNSASDSTLLDLKNNAVDDAHGDVHSVKSQVQPSVFAAYGVTDNLTLGIRLPYVQRIDVRSPNEDGDTVNNLGNAGGFGGVSLFSQYRFFHTADNLNHLSVVAALKTPSGATNVQTTQGTAFETHHQPNSGSWDPALGFSFTRAMGKFSLDSSILYTVANRGTQNTNIGNSFDYNVALSYAFVGMARNNLFVDSNNAPWTGVLELNGMRQDRQITAGLTDPNSGGNIIYISPGIRYSGGKNWNTALSIGTPIVKNINGYQTPPDYRVTYRLVFVF
ncbi:MAG: transporter [Candidatus Nitrotoga sp.]|nr:transporter [Candidatus Nitrotoga sp.]